MSSCDRKAINVLFDWAAVLPFGVRARRIEHHIDRAVGSVTLQMPSSRQRVSKLLMTCGWVASASSNTAHSQRVR